MQSQSEDHSDHFQNQNQQEQQQRIAQLKQSIQINNHEMHELVLNQQAFINKISHFNNQAKEKIELKTQFSISQALIYLKQAQKILEYGASCGKNINRQLIVCVLHNQACIYQILWQLEQCSNYLDALIYNYETYLKQSQFASCSPSYINQSIQNNIKQSKIEASQLSPSPSIVNKQSFANQHKIQLKLVNYYFQHCAVSSQLQNNTKALQSARKSSKTIKSFLYSQKNILKQQVQIHQFSPNKFDTNQSRVQLLLNMSDYGQLSKVNLINFKQFFKSAHFSLQLWTSNKAHNQSISNPQIKQKLKSLAIGSIMEIIPKFFLNYNEINSLKIQNKNHQLKQDQNDMFSLSPYILKVFFLSVSYFSIATQLRLVANNLYKKKQQQKKNSQQYKQSIMYHLLAIIVATAFIPYQSKYIQDILASYTKHYNCNLQEYKPVETQSLQKISILMGFPLKSNKAYQNNKIKSSQANQSSNSKDIQKNQYNLKFKVIAGKKKKQIKQKQKQKDIQNHKETIVSPNNKNSRVSRLNSQNALSTASNLKKSHSKSISGKFQISTKNSRKQTQKHSKQKLIKNKSSHDNQTCQEQYNAKLSNFQQRKSNYKQRHEEANKNFYNSRQKKLHSKSKGKDNNKNSKNKHNPRIVSEDQQFFIYVSKKTTKLNNNSNNHQSPRQMKESFKATQKSRKSNSSTNVSSPKSPGISSPSNFYANGVKIKKIKNQKILTSPRKGINIDRHYF